MEWFYALEPWSWPFTVISLILVFSYPLYRLLVALSKAIGKVKQISIGGVTFTANELNEVLEEREKLKAGILIATAGRELSDELRQLKENALGMDSHIRDIEKKMKEELLLYSIRLASADKILSMAERKAIMRIAQELRLSRSQAERIVASYVREWGIRSERQSMP